MAANRTPADEPNNGDVPGPRPHEDTWGTNPVAREETAETTAKKTDTDAGRNQPK